MAKKWKKKEIEDYISTKQISQENYVAPTVQTNYTPSVASTVDAFNSVQPTIKSVEPTIQTTQTTVEQPKEETKGFSFSIDNKKEETPEEERKRKIQEYNEKVAKMNGYDSVKEYDYAKAKEKYEKSSEKVKQYEKEKGYNWFKNIFTGDNENDKKYKKLIEEESKNREAFNKLKVEKNTEKTQKDLEKANPVASAIARTGIAFGSGATRGFEGIESSVRKITGQEQETNKYNFNEPMLNAAQQGANKGEQVAMNIAQSWGQMTPQLLAPGAKTATALGFLNYGGSAYNDAKKDGATEEQATMYGIASGSTEMLMEKVLGGFENVYGKKMGKDFTSNVMSKFIKNKAVRDTLSGMKGEFTEEYLQEFLEPILKNIILKEDNGADFWNTMKDDLGAGLKQLGSQLFNEQNLVAGLYGAASSGLLQGPMNFANQQMQQQTQQQKPLEQVIRENIAQEEQQNVPQIEEQPQIPTQTPINTLSSNIQEQNIQTPFQEQTPQITPLNQVNQELQETRQNDIADSVKAMNLQQEPEFTQKQGNYVYEKSDNSKIDNLRKDAANYLKEGEQTTNFVNTLEKLVKDKDIEIRFDTKLGNNVNGTYKNGVITINPNSNRAGEFVAIHELTHAIGTKPMIDMIQTYRKSNAEFNNAVERLLSTYNTTEINEEALGDIAGQLFGNQEYINNLSMENPSLFKKIYNEIKYLWHQFTGYKNQDQFIEDLRNKWESAYRNQKVQQKAKNSNIEMSNQTDSNGNMLSNEQVDYFKNSKVRDKDGKLMEIYHGASTDFNVYDTKFLGKNGLNYGIGFYLTNDIEEANKYAKNGVLKKQYVNIEKPLNLKKKTITENEIKNIVTELNNKYKYYKTSEELTNAINQINNLENNDYILSTIKDRFTYPSYELDDLSDRYATIMDTLKNNTKYDGIIIKSPYEKGKNIYIAFEPNQIKNIDNLTPTQDDDIRYSKEELTKDNTGRELSKQQQEYFKDTKVRDNNGNLITVYHTMTDRGPQFNEFNPTGTDYYKFGDQIVNYFTDSKEMSGSYADQRYEMADTKKITSMDEAENLVKQMNTGLASENTIRIEPKNNGYQLVNNLYKEAYDYAKSVWENEITPEEKEIERKYEELFKKYVASGYDNNAVPEFTSLDNYAREYAQKLDKIEDKMTPEERNAFLSFRKSDIEVEKDPIVIAEYDNQDKLFRNLKQDIQRADTDLQNKYQYEGYVNLTNPYIIDAEGRTWNKVESKADSDFTKELLKIPKEDRQYLERLASDSIKTYNDNLFNYQQAERSVNDFAVDRDNTTLEQRLIHRTIHDLGFEDFMKVLNNDKNVYWGRKEQFMDDAFNNGFATLKQKEEYRKTGKIPEEVLNKINKLIHEPAKYEDRFIKKELEVMGMKPDVKETTIYDLYKNLQDTYKTFDEGGRYEYSKFNNKINEENLYRAIGNEELFKIAKKGFTDENVRMLYNEWSVTNDIVKKIIELNKYGENYDGVIMKNVVDYGGESSNHAPHNLYITFNSNQFKAVDNTNPTEDLDIRYSKDNQTWKEYLEKEFPSQGTRTNLQDINERNKPKQENKTTQEEKPQEMPKNEVKQEVKKSYLTNAEQNELDGLKAVENSGFAELTKEEQARMEELEKKSQGITKKFPDLKTNNQFEDIKGIYGKYKDSQISRENNRVLNRAKNIIEANKQGRRTKEQWLQVAEFIGSNANIKSSQDLQQLAMETWFNEKPNNSSVLNRQGQKYVKFTPQDWVNAVYKGAGVGTDIKLSKEESQPKQIKATDTRGKQVDLKPNKDGTYTRTNIPKAKPQEMPKNPVADSVKAMNLEKENIKYSAEEKIEKSVRNQYKGLSEDKIQQIIELKEEQKEKDKMYSNFSNKQKAKQRTMINAYETNAKIRKIVQGDSLQKVEGGLTDKELAKAIEKENSNYIGKNVMADGKKATIIGNPYGRVKVEFEDGSIKTFDKDDITTINKPKQDDVVMMKATDTKGNKVDLKPSGNNTYEQVNVKPKKNDVIPDMSNKVLNIGNEKVSNFYSNITEKSKFIAEENREALKDNANLQYYDAITNKETLESAMDKLNKEPEKQVGDFFAKKDFDAEDVATGWILVKRYQDAGNYEAMSNVIEKMREQGTKAGQTVQAYGILQRLTPEGMEYYSQKQLDKAFNEFSKNKSKKQIEKYANDFTLTAEEHQFIKDQMEKVQNTTDEETKKVEIAKIVSMLSDKMPPVKGQRIKAWMRIAMLGNPKTQVRNVMGNAIIQPVNWVGDVFSATADKIISKKTGVRTKGATDFGALVQGTKKGFKDAVRDAKTGVDTRDINLDRFEENIGSKPFYEGHKSKLLNAGAKALNKTNKILGNVMSGGDRIFYQGIYENSLKNQMKLNRVDTPTQEMIDIATNEALQRTWNDSNEYTKAVLQIRNAMNKLNVKGYGLGDVLVPFAKTPANLTKAIVDYSPVGLARTIYQDGKNLKNSLENGQYNAQLQHKFADSLGKGFAGTLLYLTAYGLAQAGITSGKSDDDKDVANFMRNTLGIQPYSIKIGDKSFTYDWAQPIAAPFSVMADAKKLSEAENRDLGSIIKTATSSASNILLEQSFLSSIQDVFNSYEGPSAAIKQQIQDLPARATPTFFKQIADLIDPTQRQTYVKGNEGETVKNKVQTKIPGASKDLTAQRDTLGREIKKYGGDEDKLKYAFNVFLNPANTNKGKTSKAAEEIYEVYKATGDKTIMPRQVGYSENIGGTTRNLTAEERNEWQKLSGEKIEENVKALTQNEKYNSMSDEDKAAVINGIVNYSFAKAKSDLFDTNISTMYRTAAKKEEQGIPLYDYYIERISKRR